MDDLIRGYFWDGYTNAEIISLLQGHSIVISLSTLKRNLRHLNLRRRDRNLNYDTVVNSIQNELQGSGSCLGYRSMTARLRSRYRLSVPRDAVMGILRIADPDGVSTRRSHRLSRREYYSKGPNYLVHIDGYDKLKPFGFAIHGAIDGFSRRILWLKVGRTNKDPHVTAHHFVEFLQELQGVPRCIRMDRGTENGTIEDIQAALRWDHADDMAGPRSVLYGCSHRNQRIERWWLSLRQMGIDDWINLGKDLESSGLLETDNYVHIECLQFCATQVLQVELDQIKSEWNRHRVSCRTVNAAAIGGKPDLLYFLPQEHGTVDYKLEVDMRDLDEIKLMCTKPSTSGCDDDIAVRCSELMRQHAKVMPTSQREAIDLYGWLRSMID